MKQSKKIRMIAAAASLALALGATVFAATYDSSEDPLVSLSYLTNIFKPEMQQVYEQRISDLESRLQVLESAASAPQQPSEPVVDTTVSPETEPVIDTTGSAPESAAVYEVVELSNGDALYAVTACDLMVRSGSAACIAPDASQGIADYTDGYEVFNNQAVVRNHMLLIPRGDGRGIRALSDGVFVMVRGEYTIVEG